MTETTILITLITAALFRAIEHRVRVRNDWKSVPRWFRFDSDRLSVWDTPHVAAGIRENLIFAAGVLTVAGSLPVWVIFVEWFIFFWAFNYFFHIQLPKSAERPFWRTIPVIEFIPEIFK